MDDLISRRAALDALDCINGVEEVLRSLPPAQPEEIALHESCTDCPLYDKDRYRCPRFNKVIPETLRELQLAKPEQQWIPVSERLPKDMQFVLLTVRRLKNEYNPRPFISVGYIGWNQQHWWCAHDGDCEISKVEVIAWMPLPEPYKEGVRSENERES